MTEIVPAGDAVVEISETAWLPQRELTFEEWAAYGKGLLRMGRAWQWWVGDWVNYGERVHSETYSQALDWTGFEYQTLRNVASVARRVDLSRRRDNLSWSHHEAIAQLAEGEQDDWLDRADSGGYTVQRLRAELRGGPPPDDGPDLRPAWQWEIRGTVRAENYEAAQRAVAKQAESLGRDFTAGYKAVRP